MGTRYILIMLTLLLIGCKPNDKEEIERCFGRYRSALVHGNGPEAAKYIDKRTLAWYDDIHYMALHSDSINLEKELYFDKFSVLLYRHMIPADSLLRIDGRQMFIKGVNTGLIEKGDIVNMTVESIEVNKDSASVNIITAKGERMSNVFRFRRDKDGWKIDMSYFSAEVSEVYREELAELGAEQNQLIMESLQEVNGKQPSTDIWQPLAPGPQLNGK